MKALEELPDWLPDGWIMEIRHGDDDTIYRYYTSPISGYTFTMESEVLHYLFSGIDEDLLESKSCIEGDTLQKTHECLPKGSVIEARDKGEKIDKMDKHVVLRKRLRTKGKADTKSRRSPKPRRSSVTKKELKSNRTPSSSEDGALSAGYDSPFELEEKVFKSLEDIYKETLTEQVANPSPKGCTVKTMEARGKGEIKSGTPVTE